MRVLHTNIVLRDCRKRQPDCRPQVGDVAELADGRLVARCRYSFADGTSAFGCRDYARGEKPDAAPTIAAPTDWSRWIDHELNRKPGWYRTLEASALVPEAALEHAAFSRQWPHTAARMGLAAPAPQAVLFKIGEVHHPYLERGVCWRQLIDRHVAGDFGEQGKYGNGTVSEEELFTLAERPIVVANRASIGAKSGPVRSRYRVPVPERERMTTHALVDVVTVISPRNGPRTLMTCVDAEGT